MASKTGVNLHKKWKLLSLKLFNKTQILVKHLMTDFKPIINSQQTTSLIMDKQVQLKHNDKQVLFKSNVIKNHLTELKFTIKDS
jgi:hypothetical protein